MKTWRPFLLNLVRRNRDGSLWTADGACMFPFFGWNFARAEKALLGWWVYPSDRWVVENAEAKRTDGFTIEFIRE